MRCLLFIEETHIPLHAPTHQTHSEEAQKEVGHPVIWPTTTILLVLQLRFRLGSTYNFTQNILISVCSSARARMFEYHQYICCYKWTAQN